MSDRVATVHLLERGLALGDVDERGLTVYVNNRVQLAETNAIGVVPVVRCRTGRGHCRRPGTDISIMPPSSGGGLRVNRECWDGDDSGVLFVRLSKLAYAADPDEVNEQIAGLLELPGAERCIVPKASIDWHPKEVKKELCFAIGSCQYTAGILDRTPRTDGSCATPGPADASFARLARRLKTAPGPARPELLILAGDAVYVDATGGLFDPPIEDGRFLRPYEQLFSSVHVQDVTRQIRVVAVLDDHELEDGWENEQSEYDRRVLKLGRESFQRYLRKGSFLDESNVPGRLWGTLSYGGIDFFVMDTRSEREKRTAATLDKCALISKQQQTALMDWLIEGKNKATPRFVVSPSILLPRRLTSLRSAGALHSDAWDGYPASMSRLMSFIADEQIANAVFLSGDEHRCVFATATLERNPKTKVRSIHSSGLYSPFPFANAIPEDFCDAERYVSSDQNAWQVSSRFAEPGHGFAVITVRHRDARGPWEVTVELDLDSSAGGFSETFAI